MLNLKVYNKEPKQHEVRVALFQMYDRVALKVVDENGEAKRSGSLLYLLNNGKCRLIKGVSPEYGFELDIAGRVQLSADYKSF